MPQQFTFMVDGATRFQCTLASEQCTAKNASTNQQCRNRSVIGVPLCWQHLKSQKHLRVKESTIAGAGRGLFAQDSGSGDNDIVFRKDDVIVAYSGDVIDNAELERRYGEYTAPYGIMLSRQSDKYEDAACRRGVGSLVNHSPANANVKLSVVARNGRHYAQLKATRPIRNGRELFTNYGRDYRFQEPGAAYMTKPLSSPRARRR